METWKCDEFGELIKYLYGENAFADVRLALRAFGWKLLIAKYHAEESKRLLNDAVGELDREGTKSAEKLLLLFEIGSIDALPFFHASVASEAHLIAHAQAIHSVADILSQIVYVALQMACESKAKFEKNKCTFHKLLNVLKKTGLHQEYANVLAELPDLPEFRYYAEYVNITKHRNLVDTRYRVDSENSRHGIIIKPFKYKYGHRKIDSWPEKWALDLVEKDFAKVNEWYVSAGIKLQSYIRGIISAA